MLYIISLYLQYVKPNLHLMSNRLVVDGNGNIV